MSGVILSFDVVCAGSSAVIQQRSAQNYNIHNIDLRTVEALYTVKLDLRRKPPV